MAQKTGSSADLTWLLDDLVGRVKEAEHGILLSTDGLLMAASQGIGGEDAEHLSAVAAGVQSLARGVSERFGGGLLEYPQYTRPASFRGWEVPDVLLSGDHARIDAWRRDESRRRSSRLTSGA